MEIRAATLEDLPAWCEFRSRLYSEEKPADAEADIRRIFESPDKHCVFLLGEAQLIGFAEMALRNVVDGCYSSPVGFLEGIYVEPEHRGNGGGRLLLGAAETWARAQGCTEFASDSLLENTEAHEFHQQVGFSETSRVVQFRKEL